MPNKKEFYNRNYQPRTVQLMIVYDEHDFGGLINEFETEDIYDAFMAETDEEAKDWLGKLLELWPSILQAKRIVEDELFSNWNEEQGEEQEPTVGEEDSWLGENTEEMDDLVPTRRIRYNSKKQIILSTREEVMEQSEIFDCITADQSGEILDGFEDCTPEQARDMVGLSILRVAIMISDLGHEVAVLTVLLTMLYPNKFQDRLTL